MLILIGDDMFEIVLCCSFVDYFVCIMFDVVVLFVL